MGSSQLPPPCRAAAGQRCSSKGGWKRALSDAALIALSAPREEGLIQSLLLKDSSGLTMSKGQLEKHDHSICWRSWTFRTQHLCKVSSP